MPVALVIGSVTLQGYAYYDQRREQDERHQFYHRVHDIAEKLRRITLRPWLNLADVVKETAKSYSYTWNGPLKRIRLR